MPVLYLLGDYYKDKKAKARKYLRYGMIMEENKQKKQGNRYGGKRPQGNGKRPEKKQFDSEKSYSSNRAGGEKKNYSQNKPRNNNNKRGGYNGGRRDNRDSFSDVKSFGGNYVKPVYDYDDEDIIPLDAFSGEASEQEETSIVAGRNAVRELLRSDRSVDKLFVKSGAREGSIVVIVTEAISRGIPVIEVSGEKLDSLCEGVNHQGVVAFAAQKQYTDIEGILAIAEERGETPLVVIADCIEDPRNLGALIRCAECAGAHGIIIPKRRSAGLSSVVAKASAGAIEHMAIAKVANLSHTIEVLKKRGLWVFASEAGATPYYEADFKVPAAIIFGSEGAGVSKMLKEKCDFLISIPMYGKVNSLNVSTAASVILCHAARIQHS